MKSIDLSTPDYFHKVVDSQWACPAHTPVPQYIRLIAKGHYAEAYMVNWEANVFPGILGASVTGRVSPPAAAAASKSSLCVQKTLSVLISRRNRLTSAHHDCAAVFRNFRVSRANQVEDPA